MKTFTIESVQSPVGNRRVLAVALRRHGKTITSIQAQTEAETTSAFWSLRAKAQTLGGTHVFILGTREAI